QQLAAPHWLRTTGGPLQENGKIPVFGRMRMKTIDLNCHGITVGEIDRNTPPSELYAEAIRKEKGSSVSDKGALIAYSGEKTGRSPQDKRIVQNAASEKDVWWGPVNVAI